MPHPRITNFYCGSPEVLHEIEGATQSFVAGNLVKFSSGKIIIMADNDNVIAGQATADATGTTDDPCDVTALKPGDVIVMGLDSGLPSALTVNARYEAKASSGIHVIDATTGAVADGPFVYIGPFITPGYTAATATLGRFRIAGMGSQNEPTSTS